MRRAANLKTLFGRLSRCQVEGLDKMLFGIRISKEMRMTAALCSITFCCENALTGPFRPEWSSAKNSKRFPWEEDKHPELNINSNSNATHPKMCYQHFIKYALIQTIQITLLKPFSLLFSKACMAIISVSSWWIAYPVQKTTEASENIGFKCWFCPGITFYHRQTEGNTRVMRKPLKIEA